MPEFARCLPSGRRRISAWRHWKLATFWGQSRPLATAGANEGMFRRRRRRSGFSRRTPPQVRLVLIGAGVVAFIALFAFFIRQADVLAPAPQEIRVDVSDTLKE
jgi:hypothetical protein